MCGEVSLTDLECESIAPAPDEVPRYAVSHRDGRRWVVRVDRAEVAALPESCGKAAITVSVWHPSVVES
jgi:hypothetical protein